MKKIYYLIACTVMLFIASCSNDDYLWKGDDYARIEGPAIWTLDTDSLLFSFASYNSDITKYTIDAKVYITGKTADYDRTISIESDESKTTAQTSHYAFSKMVLLPAGSHYADLPITLFRTEDLLSQKVQLYIKVGSDGDLKAGIKDWECLKIIWSDMIAKPANWDILDEFFGTYSDTKYRFIINTLGTGVFTYGETGGMSWGEMNHYKIKLVETLNEYNTANPESPLTDEFNQLVTF